MMKLKVTTLLLGAMFLFGLGSTNLMAAEAKCGAEKKELPVSKCGADKKAPATKCGADKKAPATKCGADKKEAPKSTGKCGVGKCG